MFKIPFISLSKQSVSDVDSEHRRPLQPVVTLTRIIRVVILLLAAFLIVLIISLVTGPGDVSPFFLASRLFSVFQGAEAGLDQAEKTILLSIRLPRILFAGIVGAALSAAGVVFQAVLRNPLADPYILGISGGAAVGAIIGIIIGAGAVPFGVAGLAFLGALLTIITIFGVAGSRTDGQSNTLLLTGVIINAFFSAIIMFLIAMSSSDRLHSVFFWLMGDLSLAEGSEVLFTALFLLTGFIVMLFHARSLNLLLTGEETAMQLGVDVEKTKKILLVTASMTTAAAVSVSGTIGFVGLIIPHLLRLTLGPDHRLLLPAAVLFGASFLAAADTIARSVMAPVELPVGVITALCGAPYFIYLLYRRSV
ncbi:MAG: iron ABC transporter permease [Deltaproteobacteria bacterium HGW-Deltaproteobacteria-11]|nr:MAG: iron ABC transporter permease [Deltaproteobacteria bacterium HGW-Deltaproteobacteria-11]